MVGIYKITSPSGKIYIGQSINIEKTWKYRYKNLNACKRQTILYNSLKKHGYENHTFEVIEECNEYKLLERETYWKEYYKVLEIPSLCCRMDGRGGKLSEETKQKISKANKGKTGKYLRNNELRNNVSKYKSKPIYQFSLEGVLINKWDSISSAEKILGTGLKSNLKKETKTSKGYVWSYKNEFPGFIKIHGNNSKVVQYDLEGNFIKEWLSMMDIQRELGYPNSNISAVCRGKQKTAYGFIWKFK